MSIEAIAGAAAGAAAAPSVVQMGYAANLGDVTGFQNALAAAQPAQTAPPAAGADAADAITPALRGMFNALERVNGEAKEVADYATQAQSSGSDMTPGEVIQLTMRCHEFMFHCQLSSSVANRTSDGLQQLFRQQS